MAVWQVKTAIYANATGDEVFLAYNCPKLILDVEFEGTVRVPALFDLSTDIHIKNIVVDINALADRSLCQCPTWDDGRNHTKIIPSFLQELSN